MFRWNLGKTEKKGFKHKPEAHVWYLSRKQISVSIWGCGEEVAGRTLEQHIYKLRKKLSLSGVHGVRLSTQYAHGYRIETFSFPTSGSAEPLAVDDIVDVAAAPDVPDAPPDSGDGDADILSDGDDDGKRRDALPVRLARCAWTI